jgi:hypothetical protein
MYGPTAEKGYCRRPELTCGTSRVVLMGLSRVDCVHGPDVRVFYDDTLPALTPRRLHRLAPKAAAAAWVMFGLLALAWPACAPC